MTKFLGHQIKAAFYGILRQISVSRKLFVEALYYEILMKAHSVIHRLMRNIFRNPLMKKKMFLVKRA